MISHVKSRFGTPVSEKIMHILLTNDDGIYADGIAAMYQALLRAGHQVDVVAPSTERSAVGHAITVSDPLKVFQVDVEARISGTAVVGTPADCVKLAVNALLKTRPDLVISGINRGSNTGNHVIYSGTVSAATEAAMFGLPALAVSLDILSTRSKKHNFAPAAELGVKISAEIFRRNGLPTGTLLNLNVPECEASEIKGIRIAKQARFFSLDVYEERIDPFERTYYWPKLEQVEVTDAAGIEVDYRLLKEKYAVLTPIQYDLTDYRMLDALRGWNF